MYAFLSPPYLVEVYILSKNLCLGDVLLHADHAATPPNKNSEYGIASTRQTIRPVKRQPRSQPNKLSLHLTYLRLNITKNHLVLT